jgi:hypothetical protein
VFTHSYFRTPCPLQLPEPWRIPLTDPVDRTLQASFRPFTSSDESLWISQAREDAEMSYINMQLNPEGYTGYEGFAPHRIWSAIYEENCFHMSSAPVTPVKGMKDLFGGGAMGGGGMGAGTKAQKDTPPATANDSKNASSKKNDSIASVESVDSGVMKPLNRSGAEFASMCHEQRVLYRLLSGMHASISCHIAESYPIGVVDPSIDLHSVQAMNSDAPLVGPNVTVFQERVGAHPDRLENMYFAFVFMLRAANKAARVLREYDYATGVREEDEQVRQTVRGLLDSPLVSGCSSAASFDETAMFTSPHGRSLRTQLRGAFRNISRIMDCVGCEKCKLHGKLQILGLGTALKILFNDESSHPLKLERNEVMAFFVTLAKLSHSLHFAREMEGQVREQERLSADTRLTQVMSRPSVVLPLTFGVLLACFLVATTVAWRVWRTRKRVAEKARGDRQRAASGAKREALVAASRLRKAASAAQ